MSKLRIASQYCNLHGRNDGAPLYIHGVLQRDFPEIEAVHLLPFMPQEQFGTFDLHLWVDHGEDAFPDCPTWETPCPHPNLYWVSDLHMGEQAWAYRVKKAKEFDLVCCYHQQHVDALKKLLGHARVYWMPVAADEHAYPREVALKKYDTCFIGYLNNPARVETLDQWFKWYPNFFFGRRLFDRAAEVYHESRICLNHCMAHDLNMRHAEVTCAGGLLLTEEHTPGLSECWVPGKELVTYQTLEEAKEKADWLIVHDEEREEIALAGHRRTMQEHLYRHRVQQMLALAGLSTKPKEVTV